MKLSGDLGADQTDRIRKTVLNLTSQSVRDIVIDASELESIDSKGLETLLWIQTTCADHLGEIRLAGSTQNIHTVLEMTRLRGRLICCDTVEASHASLNSTP